VSKPELPRTARDPDGRSVEFSEWSWRHIMVERPQLLDDVDAVLAALASPDYREDDPIAGRERFYQQRVTDKVRWLRVVVDFNRTPAVVVTAFIQRKSPGRNQ
jgi:hypothetical protein